jgi:hypothetical protein
MLYLVTRNKFSAPSLLQKLVALIDSAADVQSKILGSKQLRRLFSTPSAERIPAIYMCDVQAATVDSQEVSSPSTGRRATKSRRSVRMRSTERRWSLAKRSVTTRSMVSEIEIEIDLVGCLKIDLATYQIDLVWFCAHE